MIKGTVFILIALVGGLWYVAGRGKRYAAALRPQCICCDSYDVDERPDLSYTCRACGFASEWEQDPTRRQAVELMQALTRARDDIALARSTLHDTTVRPEERQSLSDHYQLSALGHLQNASDLDPSLLEDLHKLDLTGQEQRIEQSREIVRSLLVE